MQSRSSPTPHTKKRKQPSKGYKFSKCSSKESLHHPLAKCCSSSSLENPVEAKGSTPMYHPSHVEYLCCLPIKKKKMSNICVVEFLQQLRHIVYFPILHCTKKEKNPMHLTMPTLNIISHCSITTSLNKEQRRIPLLEGDLTYHKSCQNLTVDPLPISKRIKHLNLNPIHF